MQSRCDAVVWFTDHIAELSFCGADATLEKDQPAQSPTFLLWLGARLCQIAGIPTVTPGSPLVRSEGGALRRNAHWLPDQSCGPVLSASGSCCSRRAVHDGAVQRPVPPWCALKYRDFRDTSRLVEP